MAIYNLQLPKMGESVSEATVVRWLKHPGDSIEEDEPVLEIATDKVDSDVPSPVSGILKEQRFAENDIAQVGDVIAIIETEGSDEEPVTREQNAPSEMTDDDAVAPNIPGVEQLEDAADGHLSRGGEGRFYSPLVKNIANEEGVSLAELDRISGTGSEGRVTKQDILNYLETKKATQQQGSDAYEASQVSHVATETVYSAPPPAAITLSPQDEIIEMDRMRRLIAEHMVRSKQISPHVCSFVEADVTNLVSWRNKIKDAYEKREGEKITFTPIFIEAVTKALRDFPMVNISVSGTQIIKKRNINVGMAAALPTGNLIVPVIKNADQLSLVGLSKAVNDLANRARTNKLRPDDIQDGTFTLTNIGAFGNIMGTPIINQPQVAILAVGTITKKPAVIETEHGDLIGIRHLMYLSLSYDHRVVDGALGGRFVKRVADYLENWNVNREV
ncbi:dihydrolipoamide acetyltransferase family protein [Parapedobacter indicus]|uniref:Dihydrolipoamide acetyltransferase component of pyruvate dehydrogenase complex n=1 Tax=Parapedobacter indicus TaxID=1477437 RepID=A0A1I3SUN1_9SPHI|nr:dihydrolipoamide acetyltransferase family protein [Parapedobacter indicus]PPK99694.1 2-oxoglutarate dehydrogenase E2 component (dihydrolipoamide succinyltransferase) [Parapedobacter indicus]SFJ61922.1 2-oxoglutarate dehydrogenase E2 component (dihydrolipoamide succinyltransferase) [Parapedobacter indicus]